MRLLTGAAVAACVTMAGVARAQGGPYSDVPKGHFAADAVKQMTAAGVMAPQKGGSKFDGSKPVTRYELALTLWRFAQYIERSEKQQRGPKVKAQAPKDGADAARKLVAEGYLPAKTPLLSDGDKAVTAQELSDALTRVIIKARSKKVPITPDSERAPISRSSGT